MIKWKHHLGRQNHPWACLFSCLAAAVGELWCNRWGISYFCWNGSYYHIKQERFERTRWHDTCWHDGSSYNIFYHSPKNSGFFVLVVLIPWAPASHAHSPHATEPGEPMGSGWGSSGRCAAAWVQGRAALPTLVASQTPTGLLGPAICLHDAPRPAAPLSGSWREAKCSLPCIHLSRVTSEFLSSLFLWMHVSCWHDLVNRAGTYHMLEVVLYLNWNHFG